jgi:hypothetical protein
LTAPAASSGLEENLCCFMSQEQCGHSTYVETVIYVPPPTETLTPIPNRPGSFYTSGFSFPPKVSGRFTCNGSPRSYADGGGAMPFTQCRDCCTNNRPGGVPESSACTP